MKPLDFDKLADALITGAKRYMDAALHPFLQRLAAIEERPAAPSAEEVAEMVRQQVAAAIAELPKPRDGKDAAPIDPEAVKAMVEEIVIPALAEIPTPADGKSVTIDDVAPMIAEEVAKAVQAVPAPKDGVGLAGAVIDRVGNLVVTLTDGATKELGPVVGRDADDRAIEDRIKALFDAVPKPQDGADGVGFDDMDVVETGEGLSIRFVRGDVVKTFPLPVIIDRGVFKEGGSYRKGNGVTWGGSFWIAQKDAPEGKPDAPDSGWRLAVKRGQNGKAA